MFYVNGIKFRLVAMIGAWCVTHDDESDRVNARFFFLLLLLFPFVEGKDLFTIPSLRVSDMKLQQLVLYLSYT